MTTGTLPISRLVNVDVIMSPLAAQAQSLNDLLVLGNSNVIDVQERIRTYLTLADVATDFGTTAPEYYAAQVWFNQRPQPKQIKIGRWAKTATHSRLVGATLSGAAQLIDTWTAVTNPHFAITLDGVAHEIAPASFAAETNLNGIATLIQTALNGALAGSTCVWNAAYARFEIQGGTTGATSTISFLTAGTGGTDISHMLGMRSTDSGAYIADGIDAETALAAATLFDSYFGQTWYGLFIPEAVDADHIAVGGYIEGSNNKHVYGIASQEAGILSPVSTTDIAYEVKQLGYTRTIVQYSSSSAYSVASLLGRALTVNYNGNSTVITLMYKQEPGIVAENLTATQVQALEAKNCNVFVAYNNNTAIVEQGKVASGAFIDEITGTDWLAITIQNVVYNLLYTSKTKIPQTDAGTHILVTGIEGVCSQGVDNGLLAPGIWNSDGFGAIQAGDFLPKGFYVYAQPVAKQFQADREARKSVPIQVAAKLAGAIHTVDITINVSR